MNFHSIYDQGFARIAAVTLPVHPADPYANATEIIDAARRCHDEGVAVAVFPELSVCGYAIDDLLLQDALLDSVLSALATIVRSSQDLSTLLIVGAPLHHGNRLFNCAVFIHRGSVLAVTPKMHLPTYREFYESRHFATPSPQTSPVMADAPWMHGKTNRIPQCFEQGPRNTNRADVANSPGTTDTSSISLAPSSPPLQPSHPSTNPHAKSSGVPFGTCAIHVDDIPGLVVSAEICEDMWVPIPPAAGASLEGATLICNLSASPITVGRAQDRLQLVRSASVRYQCAYAYSAAGQGESTTDLSWDGQAMICEAGETLAQSDRFTSGIHLTIADIDVDHLRQERLRQGTFNDNAARHINLYPYSGINSDDTKSSTNACTHVTTHLGPPRSDIGLRRKVERFPFVPHDHKRLDQDCYEAYNIQVGGLSQRLRSIGEPKIVIGISGGLDSTHALIVAAQTMLAAGRPATDILAYSLPGFATTEHTQNNAKKLCECLGVTFDTIDIKPAAQQMLTDMGHPYSQGADVYDVAFENVQAGLRTDYLFRIANQRGGIVLGTGDLSELALGWCTYGVGDHMSHYAINAGVPKTMIQHIMRWVIATGIVDDETSAVLLSILETEITPELIPTRPGEVPQSTEASIGPYTLQDFTLFHVLRRGARPSKIAFLAEHAWGDSRAGHWPPHLPDGKRRSYSLEEIVHWERLFLRRFFSNQFKRSCAPNGPKVLAAGSLSPRGDWRMPSDTSASVWLKELDDALGEVDTSRWDTNRDASVYLPQIPAHEDNTSPEPDTPKVADNREQDDTP